MHPTTAKKNTPPALKRVQEWFGSIIAQPIDSNNKISQRTPRGGSIQEEAENYIRPSPTLLPWERMQIYNQQYWWRLLNIMQDTYPLVTRLFGYTDFNYSVAIPYLHSYPPRHWSINLTGDRFNRWLQEAYHQQDRQFVIDSAKLDWAFYSSFFAPHHLSIGTDSTQPESLESLLDVTLYLQPHTHPFAWNYNLMQFRHEMLKQDADYWVEQDFPELKSEKTALVLFRNRETVLVFEPIAEAEYLTLKRMKQGATFNQLCEWIERQPEMIRSAAEGSLSEWIQHWIVQGWLTKHPI